MQKKNINQKQRRKEERNTRPPSPFPIRSYLRHKLFLFALPHFCTLPRRASASSPTHTHTRHCTQCLSLVRMAQPCAALRRCAEPVSISGRAIRRQRQTDGRCGGYWWYSMAASVVWTGGGGGVGTGVMALAATWARGAAKRAKSAKQHRRDIIFLAYLNVKERENGIGRAISSPSLSHRRRA